MDGGKREEDDEEGADGEAGHLAAPRRAAGLLELGGVSGGNGTRG